MNTSNHRVLVIAAAAVAAAAGAGWMFLGAERSPVKVDTGLAVTAPVQTEEPVAKPPVVVPPPRPVFARGPGFAKLSPAAQTAYVAIEAALADLRSGKPEAMKAAVERLNHLLSGGNPDVAASIAAIREFLKTGLDAATGDEFEVGEHGQLATANSLRVDLLDKLGGLCRDSGSTAALDVAAEVLGQFGSADEWAMCLRNTAWLDASSSPALAQKMAEMLNHEPWVQSPTPGFLEAFDVAAYSGATDLIPRLGEFLKTGDQNPLWRASVVGLDQLATIHPAEVLEWLTTHPEALAGLGMQRADLLAKADLADARQLQLVEGYLGRGDLSVEERGKLVGGLTTPGNFFSNNLLTDPQATTLESEKKRLTTVHAVAQQWQTSGKFPDLASYIGRMVEITSRLPE